MKSWFISDIHLKSLKERNGQTLLRFLFFLNQNPKENRLFLLGDIFEFWLSDGLAFTREYNELIVQIAKLKQGGGEVYYFEGNHDFHVDVFWTRKLQIPVYEEDAFFDLDGSGVRLEHGDFINPHDEAYLKYRALVRHPLIEPIGHILPSFFWKWLGEKQSEKSRKRTGHYGRNNVDQIKQMIRAHAERMYDQSPFDFIITGHMHILDDYTFERAGKKVRSINLGTWLEKPRALLLENGNAKFVDVEEL